MYEEDIKKFWELDDNGYAMFLAQAAPEKYPFAKCFIHTHTDMGSPKDAVLTVSQYVSTAAAMGAKAITISDHGTMYAVPELSDACGKAGIKLVIGVEFYVCDDVEDKALKRHTRLHLCGYAKDIEGYHVLCRLVTDSNTRILKTGDLVFPCVSKKMLAERLGPGTPGHGHVILTSACIGGVLTGVSYANDTARENLSVLGRNLDQARHALESYRMIRAAVEKYGAERDELEPMSKLSFKKELAALKKNPDPEKEADLKARIDQAGQAAEKVKVLRDVIKDGNKKITAAQKILDKFTGVSYCSEETAASVINEQQREFDTLSASIISEEQMPAFFEKEALWYNELAGPGNFFVEIQYHGIPAEKKYMPMIAGMAIRLNLPMVAANDAHMRSKDDLELRKMVNGLRFNTWQEPQVGDEELYLKSDIELFRMLTMAVPPLAAFYAMKGRERLCTMCDVELKKVPSYPKYVDM